MFLYLFSSFLHVFLFLKKVEIGILKHLRLVSSVICFPFSVEMK